tara:strand:- start:100 stop:873 length:774 start_codon:yes stop_codon:yes gene_type:complete
MFISASGVLSQQSKHYSTLNLGDGSQFFCCFGCKSGWINMNIANKHKDGECLTKHKDFLMSLDTRTAEEKLFEALHRVSELEIENKRLKQDCDKARDDLQFYDQVKQHAYNGNAVKILWAEEYIQTLQKVMKPIIYMDLSGSETLRNFIRADENAKMNFTPNGEHISLKFVVDKMREVHKSSPFLRAALLPSYMTFLKQRQFVGTTHSYVPGPTWLDDEFRHYNIKMPELEDIDDSSYKEASNILITPAVDASLPEL